MDLTAVKSGEPEMKRLEVAMKDSATRSSTAVRTRFESFRLIVSSNSPFLHEVAERF